MSSKVAAWVLIAAGLMLVMGVACAQPCSPPSREIKIWGSQDARPKIADGHDPSQVTIGIGSYDMFEIKTAAAGFSVAEREVIIYNRLASILSTGPVAPHRVCVFKVRSAPTIYVGPYRFVTVYRQDAQAAGTTQEALAEKWRQGIAHALPRVATSAFARHGVPFAPPGLSGEGQQQSGEYAVAFGGQLLLRLRNAGDYPSLTARGKAVESQIVKVLSLRQGGKPLAVAQPAGAEWVVKWGELAIVKVSAADAQANGNDGPETLARHWAARLNQILPGLTAPIAVPAAAAAEGAEG